MYRVTASTTLPPYCKLCTVSRHTSSDLLFVLFICFHTPLVSSFLPPYPAARLAVAACLLPARTKTHASAECWNISCPLQSVAINMQGNAFLMAYDLWFLSVFFFPDIAASPTANRSKANENLDNSGRLSASNCNSFYHPDSNYYPHTGSPKGLLHLCLHTRLLRIQYLHQMQDKHTYTHTHSGSLLSPSVFPVSRVRRFSSGGEEDGWNHNINRVREKTFTHFSPLCFKLVFVLIFNELFH